MTEQPTQVPTIQMSEEQKAQFEEFKKHQQKIQKEREEIKKTWREKLEHQTFNSIVGDIDITKWGADYSAVYSAYKLFQLMNKELRGDEIFNVFDMSIEHKGYNDFQTLLHSMITDQLENIKMSLVRNEFENVKYDSGCIQKIADAKKPEDLFKCFKELNWDLWETVDYIANKALKELKIEAINEEKVISSNQRIGLLCGLFVQIQLIKDDCCFTGFNT